MSAEAAFHSPPASGRSCSSTFQLLPEAGASGAAGAGQHGGCPAVTGFVWGQNLYHPSELQLVDANLSATWCELFQHDGDGPLERLA